MSNIKLGFSQKDITPHHSLQTIGFGRPDEWSKGVLDPLITQTLLVKKLCFVSLILILLQMMT